MQEGRGEALPHRPLRAMALWDPSQTASRIKGLSSNAAPHATNEERAAIAKSSVHAPKESPPSSGSSHIERKRDPLSRLTKKKSPIKRSPPLPKVLCLSVIAREWEKGSMLYQYVLGERHISSQKPILPVFSCTASSSFFLQARYPRQMILCPLIASFVNFSSTLSSEPSFTTISSAALR